MRSGSRALRVGSYQARGLELGCPGGSKFGIKVGGLKDPTIYWGLLPIPHFPYPTFRALCGVGVCNRMAVLDFVSRGL